MRRHYLLFLFMFLSVLALEAQRGRGYLISGGGSLMVSHRVWLQEKTAGYADSVGNLDRPAIHFSPQVYFLFPLKGSKVLQVGVAYQTTAFNRRSKLIQFGDQLHPEMPRFVDFVQGPERYVDFTYRNHYLQIPVIMNWELRTSRSKPTERYFFQAGLLPGALMSGKTIARTRGFGYDGSNRFKLNSIYDQPGFNVSAVFGVRMEFRLDETYRLQVQPNLTLPLTPAIRGDHFVLLPSAGLGVMLSFDPKKLTAAGGKNSED